MDPKCTGTYNCRDTFTYASTVLTSCNVTYNQGVLREFKTTGNILGYQISMDIELIKTSMV